MASTAESTAAWPVMMTTSEETPAALIWRRISRPSMPGIFRSSKTTSKSPDSAAFEAGLRVLAALHFVPVGAENPLAGQADHAVVVDQEDALLHGLTLRLFSRRATAGSTVKVLPLPSSLSTSSVPPCSSTMP